MISLKDMFYERSQGLVGICRDVATNSSRTVTLDLTKFADEGPSGRASSIGTSGGRSSRGASSVGIKRSKESVGSSSSARKRRRTNVSREEEDSE